MTGQLIFALRIIFLREFVSSPGQPVVIPQSGTSTRQSKSDPRKEAFIPENVYDAMKENKRFDSMRVSCAMLLLVLEG